MTYAALEEWFSTYTKGFFGTDKDRWMLLKEEHTHKVVAISEQIAKSVTGNERDIEIAKIVALLHDIGRFPQMRDHGTFNDGESVDHAQLAIEIIGKEGLLNDCSDNERACITQAVLWHNKLIDTLPPLSSKALLHSNIIRDADKIDIYRVQRRLIKQAEKRTLSPYVQACIEQRTPIDFGKLENDTEKYAACLNWIHEFSFRESARIIKAQGHYEKLLEALPIDNQLKTILEDALRERINS